MASFEDYDEFGNYIGADLDSDDEDEIPQSRFETQPAPAPLEGYENEPMQEAGDMALMEVDRACFYLNAFRYLTLSTCRTNP